MNYIITPGTKHRPEEFGGVVIPFGGDIISLDKESYQLLLRIEAGEKIEEGDQPKVDQFLEVGLISLKE